MDAQEIMDLIPNRYPICYIDYVGNFGSLLEIWEEK